MNLEYFIAKRLIKSKGYKSTTSSPIIKIAIAAIAISILMMVVSVATGLGLQNKIREKIAAFSGHVILSNFDDNQSNVHTVPISINQDFYPKFKNIEGISHIQAIAHKTGIIQTPKTVEGFMLKGIGADYDFKKLESYITKGRLLKLSHKDSLENNEVVLSEYMANRLELGINDTFISFFPKENGKLPNRRVFKIVGLFSTGFPEFDASYVFSDIRHVQRINKWKKTEVGAFEIFLEDFKTIDTKAEEIYKEVPSTINATSIKNKYYGIFVWLNLFDTNIYIILVVMIVVAAINMIVALLVLILERTNMIGILKALGASNWSIRKIFIYNAIYLISKGLFWGNLIAISILLIQHYTGIIQLNPESYYVKEAPVYMTLPILLGLNLGTLLVCFIVLLIPSYYITKIAPIKAIKFE